jgi:hypothetical protein
MKRDAICFVVMSFSRNPLLEDMYNEGIKPAVEQLGFRCIRADEIEHNDRITDVVIEMIRRSDFVIADMTEERPNCYYELGYGHALGKVVIPTVYRQASLHFDVRDYHFIVYSGAEDLRTRLNKRILTSVLALGKQSSEGHESTTLVPLPDPADFAFLQYVRLKKSELFDLAFEPTSEAVPDGTSSNNVSRVNHNGPVLPLEHKLLERLLRHPLQALLYEPDRPAVSVLQLDNTHPRDEVDDRTLEAPIAIFVLDVSGSMTDEQKQFAQQVHALLTMWLEVEYATRPTTSYVIHDAAAKEVSEYEFFHTRESGGSRISPAYQLCDAILKAQPNQEEQDVYLIQFSDGDNWGEDDPLAIKLLQNTLLPRLKLFGYIQTESPYGIGAYFDRIEALTKEHSNIRAARAPSCDVDDLKTVTTTFIGRLRSS